MVFEQQDLSNDDIVYAVVVAVTILGWWKQWTAIEWFSVAAKANHSDGGTSGWGMCDQL